MKLGLFHFSKCLHFEKLKLKGNIWEDCKQLKELGLLIKMSKYGGYIAVISIVCSVFY